MKKILEYIKLSASTAETAWKIFTFVVLAAGGTTAGVLAKGSELFRDAGLLAWFGIATSAALVFSIILFLVNAASSEKASANLYSALAKRPSEVNPLVKNFEDLIIPIEALRLPGKPAHEYKSFRRCKFVGPGALVLHGGNLVRCGLHSPGDLLTIPDQVYVTGITVLQDCTIEDCEFFQVTLLAPKQVVAAMKAAIPGVSVAKY